MREPGALAQRVQPLRQRRVAEGVLLEVAAHALTEALEADRRHPLIDAGRALAVGDAVEVETRLVRVPHHAGYRVGSRKSVVSEKRWTARFDHGGGRMNK